MRFTAIVELAGRTATGIPVPEDVVAGLGRGRRVPVRVTVGGHTYRSTVAPYRGRYMLPLAAENREAAGVGAGQEVEVDLEVDDEPRVVEVPPDLAAALAGAPGAQVSFERLSYTNQQRIAQSVEGARTPETRARRIEKALSELLG